MSKNMAVSVVCLAALLGATSAAHAALEYTGVNLSGAEFGSTVPGTYGTNYTYPTQAEVDYYMANGMNTFRVPFKWERLQPAEDAAFNSAELSRLTSFVNAATAKGAYIVLDPHNYAGYYGSTSTDSAGNPGGKIGSPVPSSAYANFWSQLAGQFKNNDHVVFGLMNEPSGISENTWVGAANDAIAAIRATGATNEILVPGTRYTGAWSWNNGSSSDPSNAQAMLSIIDPGDNYAFEVHQYFDKNSSGTSASIYNNDPNLGVARITAFTDWLKANNLRGFLGEFAVPNSTIGDGAAQVGDELLSNMFDYMNANSDVWQGWTYWGGGPWWNGSYMFATDPANLGTAGQTDKPVMSVLREYADPPAVPEPASVALLGAGALALLGRRRVRMHA